MKKKIMIVEDDQAICRELKVLLETADYKAEILTDFEHAEEIILSSEADLILLDINIPGIEWRNPVKTSQEENRDTGDYGHEPYIGSR